MTSKTSNTVWIEDVPGAEYVGPTSQTAEPVFHFAKTHGLQHGCRACKRGKELENYPGVVRTSYVAGEVQHDHAYQPEWDR